MPKQRKEPERVADALCCFECYFDHSTTDRYGETKVVIVASASQLPEVNKLSTIKNQSHVTLYASFVIAHDAN